MRAAAICVLLGTVSAGTFAQDCQRATRNYEVSRNSMKPDQGMVDRAWQEMQAACGMASAPIQHQFQQPPPTPARRGPGQFVNCDTAGCWGSQNGVRYNFGAGGNLHGTDGSFCTRSASNTFSCN